MGCGASQEQQQQERRSDDRENGRNAEASPKSPRDTYAADPDPLEDNDEHPVVTVAVMADLRTRSRDLHTGGTVQRWIESITEPADADAPDVFDPSRRHMLSMESLQNRLNNEA
jgi:hypothetical protein